MAHCSVQRDRLSVTDAPIVRTFASVGHRSDSLPGIVVKHSRYKFNHHGRSSNYYILLLCRCTQSSYDRPRTSFVDRQCAIPARICRPGNLFASLCSCNCCTRAGRDDNLQVGRALMACTALTNPSGNASCADVPPFARIASATDVRSAVFVKYSAIRSYLHSRLRSLQPPMHRTQPAEIFHYQRW